MVYNYGVYYDRHNSNNYRSWEYQWDYFVGNNDFTMKNGDIMGIYWG